MSAILSGPYALTNAIIDGILFIATYRGNKNYIIKEIAENVFRYTGI